MPKIIYEDSLDGRAAAVITIHNLKEHKELIQHSDLFAIADGDDLPIGEIQPNETVFILGIQVYDDLLSTLHDITEEINLSQEGEGQSIAMAMWQFFDEPTPPPECLNLIEDHMSGKPYKNGDRTERFYYGIQIRELHPMTGILQKLIYDRWTTQQAVMNEICIEGRPIVLYLNKVKAIPIYNLPAVPEPPALTVFDEAPGATMDTTIEPKMAFPPPGTPMQNEDGTTFYDPKIKPAKETKFQRKYRKGKKKHHQQPRRPEPPAVAKNQDDDEGGDGE
jgi:hypothetical protein